MNLCWCRRSWSFAVTLRSNLPARILLFLFWFIQFPLLLRLMIPPTVAKNKFKKCSSQAFNAEMIFRNKSISRSFSFSSSFKGKMKPKHSIFGVFLRCAWFLVRMFKSLFILILPRRFAACISRAFTLSPYTLSLSFSPFLCPSRDFKALRVRRWIIIWSIARRVYLSTTASLLVGLSYGRASWWRWVSSMRLLFFFMFSFFIFWYGVGKEKKNRLSPVSKSFRSRKRAFSEERFFFLSVLALM